MERVPCEFSLIRYVPDVVKGEFVNIGVVLREAGGARRAAVKFTRDWRRVRCVHAEADVELLEALEREIGRRLEAGVGVRDAKSVMEGFEDTLSNSVQITPAKATLAENMVTEMELLTRMYIDPLKEAKTRAKSGRATIFDVMRKRFEDAGVWQLMDHRVRAAKYTVRGDPLRIDCGYGVGGEAARATPDQIIRMFQAVSLSGEIEAAKGLALSAPKLVEGLRRVLDARLELTAVVEPVRKVGDPEDDEDEGVARYQFGRGMMEERGIRVVTVNDLHGVVETAKRELGLSL